MSLEARVQLSRGAFTLDVALSAAPGETIGLLGPNGSGKSTLVEALAGLLTLESGEITLDGNAIERPADRIRLAPQERPFGVMFQGLWLFPHLDVLENVAFGPRARGVSRRDARSRAEQLMTRLELSALAARKPSELSGGEAQRVALARALAVEPRVLLLDEPLSALDLEARPRTRSLLQQMLQEFDGVRLVITHDPLEALLFADRLVILENGRIVQSGPADLVRRRPLTPYVAGLSGVTLLRGRLRRVNGTPELDVDGLRLSVPHLDVAAASADVAAASAVLATVPPEAVRLTTAKPGSDGGVLLAGEIEGIELASHRSLVRLQTRPRLCAAVPTESVSRQGLRPGLRVWASIDASAIDVYSS